MKNIFLLMVFVFTLTASDSRKAIRNTLQDVNLQTFYLTKTDAEKILGQTATLTDSTSTNKNNVTGYQCTYTADDKDPDTGKLGAIYFMIEQYSNLTAAKEKYQSFKTSNQNSPGFKTLNDVGDEAWFHTDDENFCLIIVRKNDKMLTMKVNKLTSKTYIKAFYQVAGKITSYL